MMAGKDGKLESKGGDVIRQGFMIKRSQNKKRFTPVNYKQRWFVLTRHYLVYYDGDGEVSTLHVHGKSAPSPSTLPWLPTANFAPPPSPLSPPAAKPGGIVSIRVSILVRSIPRRTFLSEASFFGNVRHRHRCLSIVPLCVPATYLQMRIRKRNVTVQLPLNRAQS